MGRYVDDWWRLLRYPTLFFLQWRRIDRSRDWLFLLPCWPLAVLAYAERVQARPHLADSVGLRVATAALLAPLVMPFAIALLAAVHHFLLLLVRGSAGGYGSTRRVVLFAAAAYWLVQWTPIVGPFAGIWLYARSTVIGFQVVHDNASHTKAAFAAAAPWLALLASGLLLW